MPITDKQVEAALRAWWQMKPDEVFSWVNNGAGKLFKFRSFRDMRAALEAATAPSPDDPPVPSPNAKVA